MSGPLGSSQWMYNPSTSFYSTTINQSLRFNNDDSAYLEFTPSSAGNRDTWTISMWVKRSGLGLTQSKLFAAGSTFGSNHNESFYMWFQTDDTLRIRNETGGAYYTRMDTVRVFRDVAAWYHIVYVYDSTQATSTDRQKLYINGVEETDFDHTTYPDLNEDSQVNATHVHRLGASTIGNTFDGYMAEVHFIDGTALDADDFGETSNGVWVPKQYSGSYGTNGWYLDFSSDSYTDNASDPDVFADQAGSNNWDAYNLAASDIVPDSPTLNYPTFNSLVNTGQSGLSHKEGNLEVASTSTWSSSVWSRMTMAGHGGGTGKFYAEFVNYGSSGGGSTVVGVGNYESLATTTTKHSDAIIYYYDYIEANNTRINIGGNYASPPGISGNEVVRMAWDCSNGKVWIGASQEWFDVGSGVGDPANDSNPSGTISNFSNSPIGVLHNRSVNTGQCIMNFGQNGTFNGTLTAGGYSDENGYGNFYYPVPSGFVALNSANLPEPTIGPNSDTQADDYFNTVLYTGTGSSQSITGVGFQPDFVWIKGRSNTRRHMLFDVVRGVQNRLITDDTNTELTMSDGLSSFDSDGFTEGGNLNTGNTSETLVAWNWKAGGTASSIAVDAYSSGVPSIASSVSANTDAGFSICTWTGDGNSGATIGHGLTSPELSFVKNRDAATNWDACWVDFSSGTSLNLDTSAAEFSPTQGYQTLGSSTITLNSGGSGVTRVNTNNQEYVAYVFKSVEGYSKVGSFIGNKQNYPNGTFVYCGFRPAFLLTKVAGTNGSWVIHDNKRASAYNGDTARLYPSETTAETAYNSNRNVEFYSNGFSIHGNDATSNTNRINQSQINIFYAVAEAPFKYSNAR